MSARPHIGSILVSDERVHVSLLTPYREIKIYSILVKAGAPGYELGAPGRSD